MKAFLNTRFPRFARFLGITPQIEAEPPVDPRDTALADAEARILELVGKFSDLNGELVEVKEGRAKDHADATAVIERLNRELAAMRTDRDRVVTLRDISLQTLYAHARSIGEGICASNPADYVQKVDRLIVFVLDNDLDTKSAFFPFVTMAALKAWVDSGLGNGALKDGRIGRHVRHDLFAIFVEVANNPSRFKQFGGRPDQEQRPAN